MATGGKSFDWRWLWIVAFSIFVTLSFLAQYRLRHALDRTKKTRQTIERLTELFQKRMTLEKIKNFSPITFIGEERDPRDEAARADYRESVAGWQRDVRRTIEQSCPEFLADWDSAPDMWHTCLLGIIKELRSSLAGLANQASG